MQREFSDPTSEENEPIKLKWSQELAASWAIFWPCWIASYVLPALIAPVLLSIPFAGYLFGKLILVLGQSLLASRLVHKDYRSFFVGVLKEGEPLRRNFTSSEQLDVSKNLLLPYVIFFLATFMFPYFFAFSWQTLNNLNSLAQLLLILILGPAAIRWTLQAKYQGFRLQAYAQERKPDPAWSSIRTFRRTTGQDNSQKTEGDTLSTDE